MRRRPACAAARERTRDGAGGPPPITPIGGSRLRRVQWALEQTSLWDRRLEQRQERALREWREGRQKGAPPPLVKQAIVNEYGLRFGLDTLVETGTLHGDMLQGTRRVFRRTVSIELDPHLAERAARRFAPLPSVTILAGDSARLLRQVLDGVDGPCLFWLDGHYSGHDTGRSELETPIRDELDALLGHPMRGHVILIDDARKFGRGDYPSVEEVRAAVTAARPELLLEVRDDIIRIHPPPVAADSTSS